MTSPIATAMREAGEKLSKFKWSTFQGEPNCQDADARASDIEDLIENILTPLLRTVADETRGEFGLAKDFELTNGLSDAMHDCLGELSKRAEELEGEERMKADRSYQRGSMSGVL